MKKMFPEEVIRHKMAMDGSFAPDEIEAFFSTVALPIAIKRVDSTSTTSIPFSSANGNDEASSSDTQFSDDPITQAKMKKYVAYRRRVSKHSIEEEMKKDGLSAEEISNFWEM